MEGQFEAPAQFPGSTGRHSFILFTTLLALSFASPLFNLARFSLNDSLFSHVLLVPVISGYIVWLRRARLTGGARGVRWWPGWVLGLAGLGVLGFSWVRTEWSAATDVYLTAQILSFCLLLWAGGFVFLGDGVMRACAFPALFLLFMVPLPSAVVNAIDGFLQQASAEMAFRFIKLSGTPVVREGFVFWMPRIAIEVARECSGIRSSLVLFITSIVAGNFLLRSGMMRVLLAVVVIPLGIVRNAFRVLVISMLCVHVDTSYIDSPIHHQGGPLFFALSLIPFSLLLVLLRKSESSRITAEPA